MTPLSTSSGFKQPTERPVNSAVSRGAVVRRPGSVICGEVRGLVAPKRAPNTPGAVWVFWDSGVLLAEDPTQLEVVER